MNIVWTADEDKKLIDGWENEGLTATQLARMIGRSRNAVIGRAHRLKLSKRICVKTKKPKQVRVYLKMRKAPLPKIRVPELVPVSLKKSIIDCGPSDCRYMEGVDTCCGHEVKPGSSYCPAHHKLCHTKVRKGR